MAVLAGFAFLAGLVTVLSPCALPMFPLLLSGTTGGRARPWGVALGFVATFSAATLALSALVSALGIPPDALRVAAAVLVLAFGLVLAAPPLKAAFTSLASRILASRGTAPPRRRRGFAGGLVLGAGLGMVWTPCVGPIMASVVGLAIAGTVDSGSVAITLSFALGTGLPLLAFMLGGRAILGRVRFLAARAEGIQRAFGLLLVLTGAGMLLGADRAIQTWLLDVFPGWSGVLTAVDEGEAVRRALEAREARP